MSDEMHHLMKTSAPALTMGLLGAAYTSFSSSPTATAAGHVLVGMSVIMCAFPDLVGRKRILLVVLAFAVALALGLEFRRLNSINRITLAEALDQYCTQSNLNSGGEECKEFSTLIMEAAEFMERQNNSYFHQLNRDRLIESLTIAACVLLFISAILHTDDYLISNKYDAAITYNNPSLLSVGIALWLGWVLYAQRRVELTPSAYLSTQPGMQDIVPDITRILRWIKCYLLLGFVFLIFSMAQRLTFVSRLLVHGFLLSGLAVMGSIQDLYNASETGWTSLLKKARKMISARGQEEAEAADRALEQESTRVRHAGLIILGVALVLAMTGGLSIKKIQTLNLKLKRLQAADTADDTAQIRALLYSPIMKEGAARIVEFILVVAVFTYVTLQIWNLPPDLSTELEDE